MEMRIRESNGTYKVTILSLVGQELAIYREVSGGLTFELREVEEVEVVEAFETAKEEIPEAVQAFEFERVPVFAAEEAAAQAAEITPEEVAFIKQEAGNNALFHKLSGLRRELATAENLPPYMIFHDKTLWGMIEKMPVDLAALGCVSGVGRAKLEKYGGRFLTALKEGA